MTTASMIPVAALAALEAAANAALALDPESAGRLAPIEGRIVALELVGSGLTFYLSAGNGRLRLMQRFDGPADTQLRGTPFALLGLALARPGEGLFTGEVTITGDTELGQRAQALIKDLDIDWEEHLSRLTGDIVAHEIGNLFRGITGFGRRAAESLRLDMKEYLEEERRDLPPRAELEAFLDEVDRLRVDLDRLEARVKRLRERMPTGTGEQGA